MHKLDGYLERLVALVTRDGGSPNVSYQLIPSTRWLCGWTIVGLMSSGVMATSAEGGQGPLLDAAKKGQGSVVQLLVEKGANPNESQGDGATALHWAVYWNDAETVKELLQAGANATVANDLGITPLWLGCQNGSTAIVASLLAAGAKVDVIPPSGETALMIASRVGNVDVVRMLIENGARVNEHEKSRGQTALMWAAASGHSEIVKLLIDAGAEVTARSAVRRRLVNTESTGTGKQTLINIDMGGYTALFYAAREGNLESVSRLLEAGAGVNETAPDGTSALVVAVHSGNAAVASFLLTRGADPNAARAGYTALHAAILRGEVKLVEELLAHGADPNARLVRGTPVRRASADYALSSEFIGATPLWLAARYAQPKMMRLLAAAGADKSPVMKTIRNEILVFAAVSGDQRRAAGVVVNREELEASILEQVDLVMGWGADVNAIGSNGNTPLHVAATRRFHSVVQYLVKRGANLNAKNSDNKTPLDAVLSIDERDPVVELLRRLSNTTLRQ